MKMSKKSKKGRSLPQKVGVKAKAKKNKKKAKKLAEAIKLQAPKLPSGKGHTFGGPVSKQKKHKTKGKREEDATQPKPIAKATAKNRPTFGGVSSESEPELIDPQWHLGDERGKWKNKEEDPSSDSENSVLNPRNESNNVQSSDLDDSESDIDEELDESELNSLLLNKAGCSSGTDDGEESEPFDDHPLKKPNGIEHHSLKKETSKLEKKANEVSETPAAAAKIDTSAPECHLSLNDRAELLREIERRSVDLASRSLYVAPVPVNCSLDLLKQLSPSVTACRLSYNTHTKGCRKYAFLEYADSQSANAARKSIMGRLFAGRTVNTQAGRPQFIANQGADCIEWKQLFVTGLHQTTTKVDLQQAFPKAQEVDYPFHARGHPLGYAVIKFVNEEVAFEAFVGAHKRVVKGQPIFINYVIRLSKNTKTEKPNLQNSDTALNPTSELSTTPIQTPAKPVSDLKRPVSTLADPNPATKKPKVLIQSIQEAGPDDESHSAQSDALFDRVEPDTDDLFVRPANSKNVSDAKPSHLLSQLVQLRKTALAKKSKSSSSAAPSKQPNAKEDEELDEGDASTSESDSQVSLAGDSTDPDSATLSEEDNDEEDSEEEEGADDVEGEEDLSDEDDEDEESKNTENGLFQCPPTAEEKAALEASEDSLGEEVDNALGAVMHARRSAMRSLKNAGSAKRAWSASGPNSIGSKHKQGHKGYKPFILPVPSKRK